MQDQVPLPCLLPDAPPGVAGLARRADSARIHVIGGRPAAWRIHQNANQMTQLRWEYTTLGLGAGGYLTGGGQIDLQALTDRLNALGDDGWELVSVFDTSRTSGQTRVVVAVLKRPVQR